MGVLSVDELKPGMILEKDVYAPSGRFLLGSSTKITSKHIQVLKSWGVVEADIMDDKDEKKPPQDESISRETLEEARSRLLPYFAATDLSKPAMRNIFNLAVYNAAQNSVAYFPELPDVQSLQGSSLRDSLKFRQYALTPRDIITQQIKLSSFPDIYHQINSVLQSPRSSATHIAEVVSKDASLSSKLLRLVNSPFYGFPRKIDTITRAVAILGTNELCTLALGISVVSYFSDIPEKLVNMKSFWKHGISCGVIARLIADQQQGLSEETYFVAGLTHDIGRLVLFNHAPQATRTVLDYARQVRMPLFQAEKEILGFDHAHLGGELLKEWYFPVSLELPVRYHHQPEKILNSLEPAAIHIADILTQALRYGSSGNIIVPDLSPGAWKDLKMKATALGGIKSLAQRQIYEIERIFLGDPGAE
ncbi:HDOD domain-containing protein [Desulfonatronospira sp.]|uniref:HDOD domain-containing protein n=1 Tax=Desulfonatronospira sp. TaxID=1962951 RepID=UPI0025C62A71|nr:HDOD domain-containing protein [Desulfonatronospira sp.]